MLPAWAEGLKALAEIQRLNTDLWRKAAQTQEASCRSGSRRDQGCRSVWPSVQRIYPIGIQEN